jgi:hypothetical protein
MSDNKNYKSTRLKFLCPNLHNLLNSPNRTSSLNFTRSHKDALTITVAFWTKCTLSCKSSTKPLPISTLTSALPLTKSPNNFKTNTNNLNTFYTKNTNKSSPSKINKTPNSKTLSHKSNNSQAPIPNKFPSNSTTTPPLLTTSTPFSNTSKKVTSNKWSKTQSTLSTT